MLRSSTLAAFVVLVTLTACGGAQQQSAVAEPSQDEAKLAALQKLKATTAGVQPDGSFIACFAVKRPGVEESIQVARMQAEISAPGGLVSNNKTHVTVETANGQEVAQRHSATGVLHGLRTTTENTDTWACSRAAASQILPSPPSY